MEYSDESIREVSELRRRPWSPADVLLVSASDPVVVFTALSPSIHVYILYTMHRVGNVIHRAEHVTTKQQIWIRWNILFEDCFRRWFTSAEVCAKNRVTIFSSFLGIRRNVEWLCFFVFLMLSCVKTDAINKYRDIATGIHLHHHHHLLLADLHVVST